MNRLGDVPELIEAIGQDSLWSDMTNKNDDMWELIKQRLKFCRVSWFTKRSFWPYLANTTILGNTFWNTDGKLDTGRDRKIAQYKAYMADKQTI